MAKGKAKIRYGVLCNVHGVESALWDGRVLVTSRPQNKRQQQGGCPLCNAQARKVAQESREAA